MRHQPVTAEKLFWRYIRDRKLGGFKFKRQHLIGRYIVDYVCLEKKVIVELDGSLHENQIEYDIARDRFLESRNYRVLRFENHEVGENMDRVLATILATLGK
jgi:very-short-patch-repair endonuclease